ncbi:MAG: DUF2092 domain-containing protein [Polyangiaceae bacterium]|nr:DUF2092 domain-containing protein [Polyangiaceae bacterium]
MALLPILGCSEPPAPEHAAGEGKPVAAAREVPPRAVKQSISPEAGAVLRKMSDYLASLKSFSVVADSSIEAVLKTGQKETFKATSALSVRRPDKLRSERKGDVADLMFVYDGKTVTLLGKKQNMYAQADAPATIDEMIDFARDRLGVEAPGADLLMSDPYSVLTEGIQSGSVVGQETIAGVPTTHIAFRGETVDWQLWVKNGDEPLPMKYVITTKDVKGNPEFTVLLRDWNVSATLLDDRFAFTPPAGAQKIEFMKRGEPAKK